MVDMISSPQTEDGFTRIANELFEAILAYDFSGRQLKVVMAIVRKTYGYGKKEDDMSASQIGKLCDIDRANVTRVLGQLEALNVITKRQGSYGMVIGLNKSYQEWVAKEKESPPRVTLTLVPIQHSANLALAEVVSDQHTTSVTVTQVDSVTVTHTKENLSKENQQKKGRGVRQRPEITFADWIEQAKVRGEDPIPEDDAVFAYAREVGLPVEFLRLCWLEFKTAHTDPNRKLKKYKNWNAAFRNAVRDNWYRIWFPSDQGGYALTTKGVQLQREMRNVE